MGSRFTVHVAMEALKTFNRREQQHKKASEVGLTQASIAHTIQEIADLVIPFTESAPRVSQALERQQHVQDALQEDASASPAPAKRKGQHNERAQPVSDAGLKENQPPVPAARSRKQDKDVVQYSRRPVPSVKQKDQAAQQQYLSEMKEYFQEVVYHHA